jgi:hypothetical protein
VCPQEEFVVGVLVEVVEAEVEKRNELVAGLIAYLGIKKKDDDDGKPHGS